MSLKEEMAIQQIRESFVLKWKAGIKIRNAKMRDYNKLQEYKRLASENPALEGMTKEEYAIYLDDEALADAVAEAIVVGFRLLQ
jgi:hypothetical protein